MVTQRFNTGLGLAVLAVLWVGAAAQSTSCTNTLVSLSPCLNYITGNSSTPSSGCCSQLASVVKSQPQCLCQVINGGGSSLGISVNQTQATALPGACNVQTPPISKCNGGSSADSPSGTPETPNTVSSGTGSKTVPSTDSGSSDASSAKMKISLLFFFLFIASYASTSSIYWAIPSLSLSAPAVPWRPNFYMYLCFIRVYGCIMIPFL